MATKEFITLEGLSTFKTLITQYIDGADADAIKSLSVSGNTVNFYKNATATGTPDYSVNLPDVSGFMSKIASATGGKIVTSTAAGQVSESATAISDLATNAFVGSIPAGAESTTVVDYIGEAIEDATGDFITYDPSLQTGYLSIYDNISNKIGLTDIAVDALATSIAATQGFDGTDTIAGAISALSDGLDNKMDKISDASGDLIVVSDSEGNVVESVYPIGAYDNRGGYKSILTGYYTSSISTGEILVVGDDSDSTIGDVVPSGTLLSDLATQTDLADKIDVIASATGGKIATTTAQGGVAESATAISDLATNAFVGSIPQGATATTVIGYVDEAIAEAEDDSEITLVEAQTPTTGYLKTYELYQGGNAAANLVGKIDIPKDLVVTSGEIVVNPTGQPAGTYLKLTIANQTTPVYINVADLCDVYTAQQSAAQVQLVISATNEISATIVAGSVTATELASNAVTTAKIADDAVTAAKVAIAAHTESKTAGADGLAFSVTTTDGQVSAVTGSIAANTYDSYGAAATAKSDVIGTSSDGASASTVWGAKAYADASTAAVSLSDIEALFE